MIYQIEVYANTVEESYNRADYCIHAENEDSAREKARSRAREEGIENPSIEIVGTF